MIKRLRIVSVLTFLCFLTVNTKDLSHPPLLVDKLVSDCFDIEKNLWNLNENRTENVLAEVEKRFDQINLDGEDEIELQFRMEEISKENYGKQISTILSDSRYIRLSPKNTSDFNQIIRKVRSFTAKLYNITSLDAFWQAALETATTIPCDSYYKAAPQQMLHRFYNGIQLAYIRYFSMFQRLYMIAYHQLNSEIDYKSQALALSEEFREIFSRTRNLAKSRFRLASLEELSCILYSSSKLTNLLQGYVDNEANLNAEGSCMAQCSDYKETKHFQCESGSLCDTSKGDRPNFRCNGVIRDCHEIDTSDVIVCLNNHDSTRRYNGFWINNKLVAGQDIGSCEIKATSWWRGLYRCTNCFCYCDDASISERHFSLREVASNINENKIITAIRMYKINGVIQFQIKERILLPYTLVDKRDEVLTFDGWVSAAPFSVTDLNVTKDVDLYELSYDKRSINLDVVKLPGNQVLTGVRFCVKNSRLTIEVRGTHFDYLTGKLNPQDDSMWFSNAKGYNEISIDNLGPPEKSSVFKDEIVKIPNAYIKFGPTAYVRDIAQTTIPFIDTTRVEPRHLSPLSGVGLYYKSSKYSSGYIAPKLIVYNYEPHILP